MLTIYNQNLHTHSTFCDGKDTPEETVLKAIELNFDSIGFSRHSNTPIKTFDIIPTEQTIAFKKEIQRLKEKYNSIIDIFCGMEFDMLSHDIVDGYDYIIGAVHYFIINGERVGFDRNADVVENVINTYFDGDGMKYAKSFYQHLARLPEYVDCDIIGHFDLITKHSEKCNFFDEDSNEYHNYVLEAIAALKGKIDFFEVNTGAIARKNRTTPYPSPFIMKSLKEKGFGVVIGSDCHDNRYLDYDFDKALEYIKSFGFKSVYKLTTHGFTEYGI